MLTEFHDALRDPAAYGKRLKEEGGRKVVGYLCSYAPEEMIYAAGAHPFRLFGTGDDIHLADAHFQSYCCSLVRGALEGALAGRFDFLDGVVFPHTCDSIQRLSDVWRINMHGHFHLDVVLPVKLDTDSAKAYMTDVLEKFRSDLERKLGTSITEDGLKKAARTFNDIRGSLKRLYELKSENPGIVSGADLYAVVKASMIMDRDRVVRLLPGVVRELEKRRGTGEGEEGKRLVLAGGICNHPDVYRVIEEAGGVVVWDDLCTGSRYFEEVTEGGGSPVADLAGHYLARPVCPAKHSGLYARAERLVEIVKEKRAAGVVFLFLKFCDPHSFDCPYLKKALDEAGIPSMVLEVEDRLPSEGQLTTRFETFVHMI